MVNLSNNLIIKISYLSITIDVKENVINIGIEKNHE